MGEITELLIIVALAVAGSALIYKLLPYKKWSLKKPKFVLFPKYIAKYDVPISEIISALEKIQFKKGKDKTFTRGKVYGDFSAKAIKLTVEVDEKNSQVKVYASFFGIVFDTGDIWQITSDIVNGQSPNN